MTAQLLTSIDDGRSVANFFSFFTIQSNLLASGLLLAGALVPRARDSMRGATTLYMVIVGGVFALLLAGYQDELQTTTPWVDTVVHRVMPVAIAADWLIDPPQARLGGREVLRWLAFPLAYLAYTMIRGPIAGWYPYPFLDPAVDGTAAVVFHCMGILLGFLGAGYAVTAIGRARDD